MNKKIWLVPALAAGLLWTPAARAAAPATEARPAAAAAGGAAAAGLEAVTPYIGQATDVVLALDLGNVDVEQARTWMQKQINAAGIDKATLDKMNAESKPEMDKAAKWLGDFKKAGGRRIFVTLAVKEMMTSGPLMIVPLEGQADGQALAKLFEATMTGGAAPAPAGDDAGGEKPFAAIAGRNLLVGKMEALNAAKTPQAAARPELLQALGANATLKIAISGANLKDPKNLPIPVEIPPQAQGLEWISLNISAPPTVAASLTVQAKDAETAKQLSDMATQMLGMMQQSPDVQQALGDKAPALVKALTPVVNNRRITIGLDTKTIETTIIPTALKAGMERMKAQGGGSGGDAPPAPGL